MITKVCCFYYRNQAYDTQIKLAVLDHNAHINREQLTAKTGISEEFKEVGCDTRLKAEAI